MENKILNSRYSLCEIGNNKINNLSEDKYLEKGYILAPYISVTHTEESLKEYKEFMKKYHILHECCPKCGAIEHSTTFMGYIKNGNDFKDLNTCVCSNCGNKHICHERIKKI